MAEMLPHNPSFCCARDEKESGRPPRNIGAALLGFVVMRQWWQKAGRVVVDRAGRVLAEGERGTRRRREKGTKRESAVVMGRGKR